MTGPVSKMDREWPETFATDELRLKWELLTFLWITACHICQVRFNACTTHNNR